MKNPQIIVNFIGRQFKRLPKNRKQLKLLNFITQTLKIICGQRREIIGFKFQLTGRLNRRTRTKTYNFKKGTLPIQSQKTRIEYAFSKGFTRSGIIGLKL
jgi:ribosomal protein S3